MSKRPFSIALALALTACAPHPGSPALARVSPAPSAPRELLPEQQVQQVLNRLAFGPRPGDVDEVMKLGVDRWIAQQLAPEKVDDRATDELMTHYASLSLKTPEIVRMYDEARQAQQQLQKRLAANNDTAAKRDARAELRRDPALAGKIQQAQRTLGEVQSAKLARAVTSDRQLQEVMVDFWENHFNVFDGKGQTRFFLVDYDRDVIRPHALGKFRDLLEAVAKSPAMLFYLDNWQSGADSLHETLAARRAGAAGPRPIPRRVLETGQLPPQIQRQLPPEVVEQWRNARTPAEREQILSSLQQRAQKRRPNGLNENYARELMELHTLGVDGGYTQHDVIEVARALTGWSFDPKDGSFVFRPALHDADRKIVLGQTLPAGRGIEDGEQVLDILAKSPVTAHFIAKKLAVRFVSDTPPPALVERAAQTYLATDGDIREVVRTIVTSPEFFANAAYRAKVKSPFELVASALRAMNAAPDTTPRGAQSVASLGEPIFGHMTPDGWPEHGDAWMNTGAILNRINFGLLVAAGRIPGASPQQWPSAAELRGQPREAQVDGVVRELLGGEVSPETRTVLMSGDNPLLGKYAAGDSVPTRGQVKLNGLAQVIGLALGAPEFQRR